MVDLLQDPSMLAVKGSSSALSVICDRPIVPPEPVSSTQPGLPWAVLWASQGGRHGITGSPPEYQTAVSKAGRTPRQRHRRRDCLAPDQPPRLRPRPRLNV